MISTNLNMHKIINFELHILPSNLSQCYLLSTIELPRISRLQVHWYWATMQKITYFCIFFEELFWKNEYLPANGKVKSREWTSVETRSNASRFASYLIEIFKVVTGIGIQQRVHKLSLLIDYITELYERNKVRWDTGTVGHNYVLIPWVSAR